MTSRSIVSVAASLVAVAVASAAAAAPGHLEGYIPVAAHTPGKLGSTWRTDVWIFSDTATLIHLWYNPTGQDNSDGRSKVITLTQAVTYLPDVVAATFAAQGKGSIHYLADAPVEVLSRTWTPAAGGGTFGEITPGVPIDAAGLASAGDAGVLRMLVNRSPGFRANLGLVNVSGAAVVVSVSILDADGQPAAGAATVSVALKPFDMKQLDDILAALTAPTSSGLQVKATITQGNGAIMAYLSEVDNTTNAPTYQEAFRFGA